MSAKGCLIALWLPILTSALFSCANAQHQRPAAAYAPLFTGMIKFLDVPAYGSPEAPSIIQPSGRKRRYEGFPAATELSSPVLERIYADAAAGGSKTSSGQRRKLQEQHPFAEPAPNPTPSTSSSRIGSSSHSRGSSSSSSSSSSNDSRRKLQQQVPAAKQRPGWTGLWWADAGGVGVAAGPTHVVHAISTVMAIYTLDPVTGNQVESKVVALQDLFAPVGAANCKEGVYDALPVYDKAAKRYILAASCGSKGAVLLAASATPDPMGTWFLYMLLADAADTSLACRSPKETAIADSVRLTYDINGVYLSLFSYCPSDPAVQGASFLALPKHKVYKGAPNFVYAVFAADQILAALPQQERSGLSAGSFKQCSPAVPQNETDAAAGAAFFVCDQVGPDLESRTRFTLVVLINTGALWQFVGVQPTSPTPFLTARLVDRGLDAPLRSTVLLPQPEAGSFLQAGGTKPAGFWTGGAVLSGGKIYTADRLDVTHTPPTSTGQAPVTLPSIMWTEVAVKVSMRGGGDCSKTSAWGSHWDWSKDWSKEWGKDFDGEWKDNKKEADTMKDHVENLEDAIRRAAANCSSAGNTLQQQQQQQGQQQQLTQVSDGSVGTTDGRTVSINCTLASNSTNITQDSSSSNGSPPAGNAAPVLPVVNPVSPSAPAAAAPAPVPTPAVLLPAPPSPSPVQFLPSPSPLPTVAAPSPSPLPAVDKSPSLSPTPSPSPTPGLVPVPPGQPVPRLPVPPVADPPSQTPLASNSSKAVPSPAPLPNSSLNAPQAPKITIGQDVNSVPMPLGSMAHSSSSSTRSKVAVKGAAIKAQTVPMTHPVTSSSSSSRVNDHGSIRLSQSAAPHRRLASDNTSSIQSSSSRSSGSNGSSGPDGDQNARVAAALAAAMAAAQQCPYVTHWMPQPLQFMDSDEAFLPTTSVAEMSLSAAAAAVGTGAELSAWGEAATAHRHLMQQQFTYGGFIGFDVGCWYCYYGKGFYYSSSWFYRYWYSRNAWGFGWYRRYKRSYAPGWSQPSKFVGHRHLLQQQAPGSGPGAPAEAGSGFASGQLQNESILVPPCLMNSTSYKNTCKQCNYTGFSANMTVKTLRAGVVNQTASMNPLGLVAPTIAVAPSGVIAIVTGYSGPQAHPNSSALAYPGIGSVTVPPGGSGANYTWKVLRTGVGKVKSPSSRWTDYSTSGMIMMPAAAATQAVDSGAGSSTLQGLRLYYGVQWSQRAVPCDPSEVTDEMEYEPTCGMPAPWIGFMNL